MKRHAFTMIEIIFIVVILGILAAIAIPKMSANRIDAKVVAIRQDVSTIMQALPAMVASEGRTMIRIIPDAGGGGYSPLIEVTFGWVAELNRANWETYPTKGVDFRGTDAIYSTLSKNGGSATNEQDACVRMKLIENRGGSAPEEVTLIVDISDTPVCRKIGTPGITEVPIVAKRIKR
ncbi:MAG: type II secretion system protein [Wolinella sp.]